MAPSLQLALTALVFCACVKIDAELFSTSASGQTSVTLHELTADSTSGVVRSPLKVTDAPVSMRNNARVVCAGQRVVVWGGGSGDSSWVNGADSPPLFDGADYDTVGGLWTAISPPPETFAGETVGVDSRVLGAVGTAGHLILIRGPTQSLAPGIAAFDLALRSWQLSSLPAGLPSVGSVTAVSSLVAGGVVWFWIDGPLTPTMGFFSYDPSSGSWDSAELAGAPGQRSSPAVVWTGDEIAVWGGSAGGFPLGDGARYNPQTRLWTAITQLGAPVARSNPLGVWSGGRLLVWGCVNGQSAPDGGLYDPATDSWEALSADPNMPLNPQAAMLPLPNGDVMMYGSDLAAESSGLSFAVFSGSARTWRRPRGYPQYTARIGGGEFVSVGERVFVFGRYAG
jgi:hypothetical protein